MKYSWVLALQVSFFGFAPVVFAQALEETTALLNDSVARGQVVQDDPDAKVADQQVKALGLGENGEAKLYELSGRIFEKLSQDSGGDAEKMNTQVQGLLRNPASLEKELSPEQKTQIHDLSTQTNGMRQAK
jgi:hypothetical protein